MESIASGTILNQRYEVIECIGIGGMSEVYKTLDRETGEFVALKILKSEFSTEADFIKRFNNEAKAAALLDHGNIVSIYGIGNDGDIHYIIMEYVEGVTLKEYIEAYQTIAWQDALKISAQILLAMDHAHSQNIIHRDIKPQNVMMGNDGSVKLADFGIARAVTGATKNANDDAGSVHYLSPEQARGGYVDERSDIYSLGISLFEMLIGVVPFDGESNVSVALKHIDGKIVPPHEIDVDIPVGVSDLVVIATRKDPAMRFQSARDMISKIKKVIENPDESLIESYIDDPEAVVAAVLSGASGIAKSKENSHIDDSDVLLSEEEVEEADLFEEEDDLDDEVESESKVAVVGRVISIVLTYIVATMLTVAAFLWIYSNYEETNSSLDGLFEEKPYTMLDFTGHKYEDVKAALEKNGMILLEPEVEYNEEVPKGVVLEQTVAPGEDVFRGKEIQFVISDSNNYRLEHSVIMVNPIDEVQQILTANNLVTDIRYMMDSDTKKDYVISVEPPIGSELKPGSTVYLYVSTGNINKKVQVPNFVGLGSSAIGGTRDKAGIKNVEVVIPAGFEVTDIVQKIEEAKSLYEAVQTTVQEENDTIEPDGEAPTDSTEPIPTEPGIDEEYPETVDPTDDPYAEPGYEEDPEDNTGDVEDIPVVDPKYAGEKVVWQYPAAGTYIYEWETVYLFYFCDEKSITFDDLKFIENIKPDRSKEVVTADIRATKSIQIEYPTDLIKSGNVNGLKVFFTFENETDIFSFEEYKKRQNENSQNNYKVDGFEDDIRYKEFPITINVPFAYGTDKTIVDIVVTDESYNDVHYRRYVVYDD